MISSFTLAVVSGDCCPLASLINVDRKFRHFFTFSSVSCKQVPEHSVCVDAVMKVKRVNFKFASLTAVMGVGATAPPVALTVPGLCVSAVATVPACIVVAVPSGCPGVAALPPSITVFCAETTGYAAVRQAAGK